MEPRAARDAKQRSSAEHNLEPPEDRWTLALETGSRNMTTDRSKSARLKAGVVVGLLLAGGAPGIGTSCVWVRAKPVRNEPVTG